MCCVTCVSVCVSVVCVLVCVLCVCVCERGYECVRVSVGMLFCIVRFIFHLSDVNSSLTNPHA